MENDNEINIFTDSDYCLQVVEAMRNCVNEFGMKAAKHDKEAEGAYKMAVAFIKTGSFISTDLGDELKKQFQLGFEKELKEKLMKDTKSDVTSF